MKYKNTVWGPIEGPIERHIEKLELSGWAIAHMWPVSPGKFLIIWQKTEPVKKEPREPFVPPHLEEVQAFINEKKLNVNARDFITFYAKRDWKNSNDKPIRNWKSTMLNNWVHDSPIQTTEDVLKPKT